MRASNVKKNIKESIFDVWFDAYNQSMDEKFNDKAIRAAPQIIRGVALAGFQDFNKRLLAAGINLKNVTAIGDSATQELIKENLVAYVEQYMVGGESQQNQVAILDELKKPGNLSLPAKFDEKTIFEYFETAAKIRAKKLNELDQSLDFNKDNIQIKKLKDLQTNLKNNQNVTFNATIRGINTTVVIRQDKIYSSMDITPPPSSGTTPPSPPKKVKIVPYGNLFEITNSTNLTELYNAWVAAGSPTASTFDESDKIIELQDSLEDNQEIEFAYTNPVVLGPPIQVIIRKDAVYVSDYTGASSSSLPPKVSVPPHGDMYEVKRPQNLTAIYQAYSRLSSPPAPRDFAAPTLE